MLSPDFEIAILGTGPVGCALALALARHAPDPARIALVGPAPRPPVGGEGDPRAIAVNHGSRQFLETLGAWPAHSADIARVHVSQRAQFGRTLIDCADFGLARLGSVVAYDALIHALHGAAQAAGVHCIPHAAQAPQAGAPVTLRWTGGQATARLAVVSHGSGATGLRRTYGQHAVVGQVQAQAPRDGWAFERFTRSGPLALLPHPAGAGRYSLVWCVSPERAQALQALSDEAFDAQLNPAFGTRLGTLHRRGPVHAFPLFLLAAPTLRGPGVTAVGNAAQTLHPVAGQGLNLGLRDAAQLAHRLHPWLQRPTEPVQALLRAHERARRADRGLTLVLTDTLARVFASRSALVRQAAGLGLFALDVLPALRRPLARHLLQGQRHA